MIYDDFPRTKYFKGGSSQAQAIEAAPVPLPAPPVTQNNAAVLKAEHDYAQQNLLKKSVKGTMLAGDTGGYSPAKPPGSPGGAIPAPRVGL